MKLKIATQFLSFYFFFHTYAANDIGYFTWRKAISIDLNLLLRIFFCWAFAKQKSSTIDLKFRRILFFMKKKKEQTKRHLIVILFPLVEDQKCQQQQ